MGKGSHYSKATRVSEGNLEGFWLLEYLRFAGLYAAGVSLVVQGSKDRKIYLPLPNRMTWDRATEHILSDYRAQMYSSTAIKLDVLAALRYMHIYLKHWLDAQDSDDDFGWGTGQPGDHARAAMNTRCSTNTVVFFLQAISARFSTLRAAMARSPSAA